MGVPKVLKGFIAVRAGIGVVMIVAPSVLARFLGLPAGEGRRPFAASTSMFFGVRELALAALTATATDREPRGLRRVLMINAATDGLDFLLLGALAVRHPSLRRGVALFVPGAALSVVLHGRAAQQVRMGP